MAIRKPPCPPNCERRRPACQGSCPDFKIYRDALDEDKRIIQEAKEKERNWTQAKALTIRRRERYNTKKSKGEVT